MRNMFWGLIMLGLLLTVQAASANAAGLDNLQNAVIAGRAQSDAGIAVEFISGAPVSSVGYEFSAWKVTVRNSGIKPVDNIQFRLNIYYKDNNALLYSQVHTVKLHLEPQDVLTSPTFPLKQKIEVGVLRITWNAELIKAW